MLRFMFMLIAYCLPSLAFATKRLAVVDFQGVVVDGRALPIITDYVRSGVLEGIGKH